MTTLSEEDLDRIAKRVVGLIAERLTAPVVQPKREEKPAAPKPPEPQKVKLAYTVQQLSEELGLSPVTIYRLEQRGLIRSSRAVRRKIYAHTEVQRFLAATTARVE